MQCVFSYILSYLVIIYNGDDMIGLLMELLTQFIPLGGFIRSQAFLKPLSQKEEYECFQKMKMGDSEARTKIIEHNLRLVAHLAKKYDMKKESNEDLMSIGTIGLMKAVDHFDVDKGLKFSTYAGRCIENEIRMHLRSHKHDYQNISLDESIADSDGQSIALIDAIPAPLEESIPSRLLKEERLKKLSQVLDILDEREKEVIERRYGLFQRESETQREIAKSMNISRSYVSRIEKKAYQKLYKVLSKE